MRKRKSTVDVNINGAADSKRSSPEKKRHVTSRAKPAPAVNYPATLKKEKLNVYVFGTGSMCELGLGPESTGKVVKRPRFNPHLSRESVGVVDVAVGGMHCAALTHQGTVLTWGVNDQGVLGRDTQWEAPTEDADAMEDEDDDAPMNPKESTPAEVEGLQEKLVVKVACGDSITVAATDRGDVYAWGTFRSADGILGFSGGSQVAMRPVQLRELKNVCDLRTGTDHALALTTQGRVFSWGNGQQFQLGRRVVERTRLNGLVPREFGLKKIKLIDAGSYHSFAVDTSGRTFSWGLNQFGQCGIESSSGEDGAVVAQPTHVEALDGLEIVQITGGEHHSAALTSSGDLYVWGRLDGHQLGIPLDKLPSSAVADATGKPRFIPTPTKLEGLPEIFRIYCGSHHNIAIDKAGQAWSWGFGDNYQVGQGPAGDDIEVPTKIENTATRGVHMKIGGASAQFSVLAGVPTQTNGVI